MKKLIVSLAAGLFSACVGASALAQDVAQFAQLPDMSNPRLSPEGRWMSAECTVRTQASICIFDLESNALAHAIPVPEGSWLSGVYFASEDYLVINVSIYEMLNTDSGLREFRMSRGISVNLHSGEATMLMRDGRGGLNPTGLASLNLSDPETILIEMTFLFEGQERTGSRLRRGEGFHSGLFRVNLGTGRSSRVDQSDVFERIIDAQGETVANVYFDSVTHEFEVREPGRNGAVIYAGEHVSDAPSILGFTDETGFLIYFPAERYGYHRLDRNTGELSEIEGVTLNLIRAPIFDWSRTLIGFRGEREGREAQVLLDEGFHNDIASLSQALGQEVLLEDFSIDRDRLLLRTQAAGVPDSYFLYVRSEASVSPIGDSYPGLVGLALPERRYLDYQASDGLEIEGVLTTPAGWTEADGPLPLIVMPHGGPAARDYVAFDWWAQAYAAQGYMVLQPNFRGSTGYGLEFQQAGYGEFGDLMVQDSLDGAQALIADGWAREGGFCVAGASYGGYAALRAAVMAPDQVACVVAFAPVTHPSSELGEARHYGDFLAYDFWEQYMGDLIYSREDAERVSILNNARSLTMPVLLLHGTEDSVVPMDASDSLNRAMRGQDNLDYVRLEGETHFLVLASSRHALLTRSLALFEQTLR